MTGYATTTPDVQTARPLVLTEVLPAARGVKPAAMRWTPGRKAGTGLLCIQTPASRCNCEYLVVEHPTRWDGRGAKFAKVDVGSDPGAVDYDVFVARNGQDRRCECRGFLRHGHCKHTAALIALLQNGWLDLQGSNPDADVSTTEGPY